MYLKKRTTFYIEITMADKEYKSLLNWCLTWMKLDWELCQLPVNRYTPDH